MIKRYASDIINAAMRMAQQQALNSFSFRDCLQLLNQHWRYCYERMTQIEPGYYSVTVELTKELTTMPAIVFGTERVYRSMSPQGHGRIPYTKCGDRDMRSQCTYQISGSDLWCWDAGRVQDYNPEMHVWLNYVPQPKNIFFTAYNRDPEVITEVDRQIVPITDPRRWRYGMYRLLLREYDPAPRNVTDLPSIMPNPIPFTPTPPYTPIDPDAEVYLRKSFILQHMGNSNIEFDITDILYRGPDHVAPYEFSDQQYISELYDIVALFFDYPYAFVSYQHRATGDYHSVILRDLLGSVQRYKYNPFDFTGRDSHVKYLDAKYNDDTGMGVVIQDFEDLYEYDYIVYSAIYEKPSFDTAVVPLTLTFSQIIENLTLDHIIVEGCTKESIAQATGDQSMWIVQIGVDASTDSIKIKIVKPGVDDTEFVITTHVLKPAIPRTGWLPKVKRLGWTPDTLVVYPQDCIADFMIAHMAKRFANRNESTLMDIDHAIGLAEKEMTMFLKKEHDPWVRVSNAVGIRITDLL
jgi:hypothetical protein